MRISVFCARWMCFTKVINTRNAAAVNDWYHCKSTVKALYFAFFPMNVTSLEFYFVDFEFVTLLDFEFVTLLQCRAQAFAWYLILRKQLIRKINPTRNLRLLQYHKVMHSLCLVLLTSPQNNVNIMK